MSTRTNMKLMRNQKLAFNWIQKKKTELWTDIQIKYIGKRQRRDEISDSKKKYLPNWCSLMSSSYKLWLTAYLQLNRMMYWYQSAKLEAQKNENIDTSVYGSKYKWNCQPILVMLLDVWMCARLRTNKLTGSPHYE